MMDCYTCLRDHIDKAQHRAADIMAADVLPPTEHLGPASRMFANKVHPIFPIFDKSRLDGIPKFWRRESGPLRPIDQLVVASICHAVSLDRAAGPYLCFRMNRGRPVERLKYRDTMVTLITEFLVKQCDKRRYLFDYLRSMTLLCFFWQGLLGPPLPFGASYLPPVVFPRCCPRRRRF